MTVRFRIGVVIALAALRDVHHQGCYLVAPRLVCADLKLLSGSVLGALTDPITRRPCPPGYAALDYCGFGVPVTVIRGRRC